MNTQRTSVKKKIQTLVNSRKQYDTNFNEAPEKNNILNFKPIKNIQENQRIYLYSQ